MQKILLLEDINFCEIEYIKKHYINNIYFHDKDIDNMNENETDEFIDYLMKNDFVQNHFSLNNQ